MNKRLLTFLTALSLAMSAYATVPFTAMGRVQETANGKVLAYPGILLEAHFTGTSKIALNAELLSGEAVYFKVELNGSPMEDVSFRSGEKSHLLASHLDPKQEYTLRMVKQTEAWQGMILIKDWEADEGVQWLDVAPLPQRKIMCLGDSITCGYNADLTGPYVSDGPHNSNAYMTYGWTLARKLGAQVNLVSYGGKGVVRDWSGSEDEVKLGEYFERALPDDASTTWDHNNYVPDLVVICIGQNDFNLGIVDASVYVPAYIRLVERIREVYPEVKVLMCSSPMQNPEFESDKINEMVSDLNAVEKHFAEKGDLNVKAHKLAYYPGSKHDAHPTTQQQQAMADEIYAVVAPWLGWAE